MSLATFSLGGVHPPEQKQSADLAIEGAPLPDKVVLPLNQHLGVPAVPVVRKGDRVRVGTLIARGEAFISAHVHASISGVVSAVDEVPDGAGHGVMAITITRDGDEWEEGVDNRGVWDGQLPQLGREALVERMQEAGVVGLGGACFPTHVKYRIPANKTVDTLVVNGVECEPFLTSDHRLMLEHGREVLAGVQLMMRAAGVSRAVVGIEANKPDAISHLSGLAEGLEGIRILPLKVRYPQGAEKQLIEAALKRRIPAGKLPLEVGCVVNNVGTAYSVWQAAAFNRPLVDRIVTLTGPGLSRRANVRVRLGMLVNDLLAGMGIPVPQDLGKVINGGPMMGKAMVSLNVPVTKGTSGLIFLPEDQAVRTLSTDCIRCARCVSVCPMGLEPYHLEKLSERGRWEACEAHRVTECIECGSCSYVCPAARPLLDWVRVAKAQVMRLQRQRSQA